MTPKNKVPVPERGRGEELSITGVEEKNFTKAFPRRSGVHKGRGGGAIERKPQHACLT